MKNVQIYYMKAQLSGEWHVLSCGVDGVEKFCGSFLQKNVAKQFMEECVWLDKHEINDEGELVCITV
jgi:hypothetical protein